MVPGITVAALEPRDHPVRTLNRGDGLGGGEHLVCRQDAGQIGDAARPSLYSSSSILRPDVEARAADRVDLKGLVSCRHAGFLAYTTKLLPIRGFSNRSAVRVTQGALVMSQTSIWWYAFTNT